MKLLLITLFGLKGWMVIWGLQILTIDVAYASFEENKKGKLLPGMLADFVVLDKDILAAPSVKIKTTKVLLTVVGGKVVFATI